MTLQMSFRESAGTFTSITGFPTGTGNNQAVGINNAGTAVGFYQDSMGAFHGYIATGTTASTFDVTFGGAMGTQAFGINNHGEIVGDYSDSMGTMHGFVYIGGVFYTVDDPSGAASSWTRRLPTLPIAREIGAAAATIEWANCHRNVFRT